MRSFAGAVAAVIMGALMIDSCGKDDTTTNPQDKTYLLSGTIQGEPLSLTSQVTTLAGSPGQSGSTGGAGTAARFNYPGGNTSNGKRLFVADLTNSAIRAIK